MSIRGCLEKLFLLILPKQKYWNWQKEAWPRFNFDQSKYQDLEREFLKNSGIVIGIYKHINKEDKLSLLIECLSEEAVTTSEKKITNPL